MQSLEPTGTRLLLLIKGPNVPAESGGRPLFTPPEGRGLQAQEYTRVAASHPSEG